jgi:hypothetical protein
MIMLVSFLALISVSAVPAQGRRSVLPPPRSHPQILQALDVFEDVGVGPNVDLDEAGRALAFCQPDEGTLRDRQAASVALVP